MAEHYKTQNVKVVHKGEKKYLVTFMAGSDSQIIDTIEELKTLPATHAVAKFLVAKQTMLALGVIPCRKFGTLEDVF
jgi:hypothetical protein